MVMGHHFPFPAFALVTGASSGIGVKNERVSRPLERRRYREASHNGFADTWSKEVS
jgi:hypothetical protein